MENNPPAKDDNSFYGLSKIDHGYNCYNSHILPLIRSQAKIPIKMCSFILAQARTLKIRGLFEMWKAVFQISKAGCRLPQSNVLLCGLGSDVLLRSKNCHMDLIEHDGKTMENQSSLWFTIWLFNIAMENHHF